ncbi:MAG: hypothetical protein AM324_006765 [Candidatus Thorarchaeota archaeon SMTZ1-83]
MAQERKPGNGWARDSRILIYHGLCTGTTVDMTQKTLAELYDEHAAKSKTLSVSQLLAGFVVSILVMVGSTWGLLYVLSVFGLISITVSHLGPYTLVMLVGSIGATIVGGILCIILVRFPRSASPALRIHRFFKRGTGEYFVSPDKKDQSFSTVMRRSLYGSVLVAGMALTIMEFDLMVVAETADILSFGAWVFILSTAILPFTILILYYGPWVIKDAGLFHLDLRDRSLSNVGDDLEDILEFFAGVDIILVWLELTITTGLDAPWLPIFVILVVLGPLYAIVMNFTLIFMYVKNRATSRMIGLLVDTYKIPDMLGSGEIIRDTVMKTIDRGLVSATTMEELVAAESVTGEEDLADST